jgi:hypothetical protein
MHRIKNKVLRVFKFGIRLRFPAQYQQHEHNGDPLHKLDDQRNFLW